MRNKKKRKLSCNIDSGIFNQVPLGYLKKCDKITIISRDTTSEYSHQKIKSDFIDSYTNKVDELKTIDSFIMKKDGKEVWNKYDQQEVKQWIALYEIYGNLNSVIREYEKKTKKRVSNNTIKRKNKALLSEDFLDWYQQYKLMGNYSWDDARQWKEIYEELHNFPKVADYYREQVNPNVPHINIIRKYVKKYITQILLRNYDEWINKFHEKPPWRYNEEDYMYWKELYEELGCFKDVHNFLLEESDKEIPDLVTIRKGLRKLLGENYELWKEKHIKKYFSEGEITEWKRLYEKYGSIDIVSKISGNDKSTIRKHFKKLMGDTYEFWKNKFYIHHSTKYFEKRIAEWKSLFEMLGSFPAVSLNIKSTLGVIVNPSVIRKRLRNYITNLGLNYTDWLNEFSLSENIVDIGKKIHQIIEYYFMLNFKNSIVQTFYEIKPTMEIDDLFRADNTIIMNRKDNIKIFNIDYLFSSNLKQVYPKMYKNYQGKESLLLIVTLTDKIENYYIPLDVSYRENIKLIYIDELFDIFSFKKVIKENIQDAIKIAKNAVYNQSFYTQLIRLAKTLNKQIKLEFGNWTIQQKDYNSRLKSLIRF